MKSTRLFTVLGALLFPLAVAAVSNGCSSKDKEELPPIPSATTPPPEPTPAPVASLIPEEDAGPDVEDAGGDADGGKKAGGGDSTGIRKCCSALAQNANSAPPEQKGAYLAAAAACNGMIGSPQGRQALGGLRAILLGAQMPAACQ